MFIVANNDRIEYDAFLNISERIGSAISKLTDRGDVVLISKRTSLEQLASFIGCIIYGRIPIIIPHPSKKVFREEFLDKMRKIDTVASPKLCISDEVDVETYSRIWRTIDSLDTDCDVLPAAVAAPNETAFIQLSSGTTGLPKVIRITHGALIAQCEEYSSFIGMKTDDVVISWLPLYHDMGLIACFLLPLLSKVSFVHIHPFDWLSNPKLLFEQIERFKGTHVWMPNFAFSYMVRRCKNAECNLSSMKQWVSCSEVTHAEDMRSFINVFGVSADRMYVCYALAENVFAASHGPFKEIRGAVSCGRIVPGTSVLISSGGKPVFNDKEGDVLLRSCYMASDLVTDKRGYYNPGDRGFISDNELVVLGRSDDMIISYGKNVYPYDIESAVSSVGGVIPGRVACFGMRNISGTDDVFVVAETDANDPSIESKIKDVILAGYDIGVKCKIVPRGYIIKTSSGKISRKRTRQKVIDERA